MYNLRGRKTEQEKDTKSETGTSSTTTSQTRPSLSKTSSENSINLAQLVSKSPLFLGFTSFNTNFSPKHTDAMTTKEGFQFGGAVSSSQNDLNDQLQQDAQDMLNANDGGADEDGINLNLGPDEATTAINTAYKRNRLNTTVCNIEDSLSEIEEMLTDQVVLNMLLEALAEANDLILPYIRHVSPVLDIPTEDLTDDDVKEFLTMHKPKLKELKDRHKVIRLKIQRLSSNETKINQVLNQRSNKTNPAASTVMKIPRITLPSFDDNKEGTIPWQQFKNMVVKLTENMQDQEAIFFLKSNLGGQGKKLVSSIEQYKDALNILEEVYGNTDKVLQSRIADFIALVTQDPNEKNLVGPNRNLWSQMKMFWTFLGQQIAESSPERVLNAIVNALIISRLPYNVKQSIIRNRRTYEEQHGDQVSTDNLLEMLNNIIHDLELTQGNNVKPPRKKDEQKDKNKDDCSHKKRSYVIKTGRDNDKKNFALSANLKNMAHGHTVSQSMVKLLWKG